jgi:hypothetical protein
MVWLYLEVNIDKRGTVSLWESRRSGKSSNLQDGGGKAGIHEASIRKVGHTRIRRVVVLCTKPGLLVDADGFYM